jgi:dihydrofolate reductase
LEKLPDEVSQKAEIVKGELKSILKSLKERGIHTLYIDGGQTIQSFLKEDLIDEMTITRIPILLGKGIPLFEKNNSELEFEHVQTQVFNNMIVRTKYIRKK